MDIGFSFNKRLYGGEKMYKIMGEAGIRALDICIPDTTEEIYYSLDGKELEEYIENDRRLIAEAGLYVNQIHGPWRFPALDATVEDRQERFEMMSKGIKICNMLGGKYFVIHPLMPFGIEDITLGKSEEAWQINKEFFERLLPVAKEHGVTICLENMPYKDFSLSKPEAIRSFVEGMNDESFMMCLDVGHTYVFNDLDLINEVHRCADVIKALHVHDNRGQNDEHLQMYMGTIDWISFGKALKEIGYKGVFSLECFEPSRRLPPDIARDIYAVYYKISKHAVGEEY